MTKDPVQQRDLTRRVWSFIFALIIVLALISWKLDLFQTILTPGTSGSNALSVSDKMVPVAVPPAERSKGMEKDARGWALKTGADPDASKINFKPVTTTIAEMNQWHEGKPYEAEFLKTRKGRISPYELQIYHVEGTLVSYQCMRDGDYHLILVDNEGHKIVAELPNPPRVDSASPCLKGITQARKLMEYAFPLSTTRRTVEQKIAIDGPAYFALGNPKWDHADNFVQIHPVTALRILK